MAIVYICKRCNGVGSVEKKVWFISKRVSCRLCDGSGKRRYSRKKQNIG